MHSVSSNTIIILEMRRLLFLSLLATSYAFAVSCGEETQSKPSSTDSSKTIIPVEVGNVVLGDISAFYGGTATLEAQNEAVVVNRVGGIIKEVFVEEGDVVKVGQVLAKIDDERLLVELERSKINLDKLKADLTRNKELFDKKLISAEAYQNSLFEFKTQEAAFELSKLDVTFTKVVAPINGVISERMIKHGNMVGVSSEMFRITDFDPLLAIMFVPENEKGKIKVGQQVSLGFDALQNVEIEGKIARISPIIDRETGTFKVTIEVRDNEMRLSPGMFSRVRIVYDTHKNTHLIPKNAVIREDSDRSVFVVRDKQAFKIPVTLGFEQNGKVEIISGLSKDDVIVTLGQTALQDSALVEPLNL